MKKILLILVSIFCFSTLFAQEYTISNVVCNPASPDTLMPGERVSYTFDYTKPAGDVRIFPRPYRIEGIGNSGSGGSPIYGGTSGAGENFFVFDNGAVINAISFKIKDIDGTQLYDTLIAVNFVYHEFSVSDITFTPESPASVKIGDSLKFSFNYKIPENFNVKIVPAAINNKKVVSKQTTSQSPTYSDTTGTGTGFIKIDTLATVDQIRFQFIDAATGDTIAEVFEQVYYGFSNDADRAYSISNIVYNPTSPGSLNANDRVNLTFNYSKPYGDVRIYVRPYKSEGSGNSGTSGSQLYTDNDGSGDAFFTYFGDAVVNKVLFSIKSVNGIVIHEQYDSVHFSFSLDPAAYSIENVVFTPASPDTIHTVDTLKFTFDYKKPFGDVKVFARPFKNGVLKTGSTSSPVKTYSENNGSGSDYISFAAPGSFDQVRFQIKSALNHLLYETFIDVDYTFIQRPVSAEIIKNSDELKIYPNPSNGEITISVPSENSFEFSIIDLSGRVVKEGISKTNSLKINMNKMDKGTYITKVKTENKQFSKLVVFE